MMNKLNNKGQSLVLFILIMPIILFIMILVIDIGNAYNKKIKLDNINYLVIDYGLDHLDDTNLNDKLMDLIMINNIDSLSLLQIDIKDEAINITMSVKVKGIFYKNLNIIEVNSHYKGYIKENKKVIERL